MGKWLNGLRVVAIMAWTAGCITLALVLALVRFDRQLPLRMARLFWAPGLLWIARVRMEIEPFPDLDWSRPYIFVMNHQSSLDIPCAFAALPTNLRFLAKHQLAWVPFLGWYIWFTGMVFVNRSNRARALESLKRAGVRIREGASLLTYPEGTRSPPGELRPFKRGSFAVALEAQVPIVPVAISGSAQALPSGTFQVRGGAVRLKVGLPIPTQGRAAEEREALAREVHAEMVKLLESISCPPAPQAPLGEEALRRRSLA